jgi:hypothetical protein
VLSASYDSTLGIWDVESGKELKQIQAHKPHAQCAAFSPDGERIVSGGEDDAVRLWDAATGKELRKYEGHGTINRVAFFPDGKRLTPLYGSDWVVYAKPPFGGPERVLKDLARYTHRVAISNHRLVQLEDVQVTFRDQDYADGSRLKTLTLPAAEFLRRFVQHVLPKGFVKVRHYRLLANRHQEEKLAVCRRLLLVETVTAKLAAGEPDQPEPTVLEPARVRCCPQCGSRRLILVTVAPGRATPRPATARNCRAGRMRRRAVPLAAALTTCVRPSASGGAEPPPPGGKVHAAGSR